MRNTHLLSVLAGFIACLLLAGCSKSEVMARGSSETNVSVSRTLMHF